MLHLSMCPTQNKKTAKEYNLLLISNPRLYKVTMITVAYS